jgi:hypothetical protein
VAIHQTGGRDPHRGIHIPGEPAGGSQPADAGSRAPPWPLAPRTMAKGLQAALPLRAPPRGRRERGDTDCAAPTGLSSRICPLIRIPPRSVRGRLAGPRRPAPRPRARRGASVLLHHHNQTRRHRHHHQARRCHPRGRSSINSSSRGSECPASKVTGRSRAPSKCGPFLFFYWSSYHVNGY